jgi:hypothetical protein
VKPTTRSMRLGETVPSGGGDPVAKKAKKKKK